MKVNSPLQYVTNLFANGKRAELARLLNLSPSTIAGWDNAKRRPPGMAGTVPAAYVPKLLRIAVKRGLTVDLAKLLPS